MKRKRKIIPVLCLLALAAPGIGQDEAEPYFALSTSRTFGTGMKASVGLSAFNVSDLEFRVYKVNDPVKFFTQLDDAHRFGGANPPPPKERTWLERIHDWKRGLRTDIRYRLRAQFTESPSARFEKILPSSSKPTSKGTEFAQAPLLNQQQLVLTFKESVKSSDRWATNTVEVPVKDKGIYLVEAVHKDLRAYTILMVSDLVMITKTGRNRLLAYVVNRTTGEPIEGADLSMVAKEGSPVSARTDASGSAEIAVKNVTPDELRLIARKDGDTIATALASYAFGASREQWNGYLYTDRPVYRPGHTVNFKGIIRVREVNGYSIPAGRQINVTINDPEQKAVYQKSLTVSANGTIADTFALPAGAALGNYYLEAKSGEEFMSGNFEVQEYKKPEYEVRVTTATPRVLQGATVTALIDSRYYFGEPVANAKVKYSVYRSRYWFPMWYDPEDDDSGYDPNAASDDESGDQLSDVDGILDADGKLTISFPTQLSEHKFDSRYRIEARVTDAANREISGTGWVIATYGSFVVNVSPDRYFYQPGSRGTFKVEARDYDSKPVQTRAHVEILTWDWRDKDRHEVKSSTDVTTGADGTANAELPIPAQGGSYVVRVTARTPEGRDIEQRSYLWISGASEMDWGSERKTVQIIPDKKTYRPGDIAHLLIITGKANTPVYVSVEGRDIRSQKLIRSTDATATFDVAITADDEPGLWVSAQYVRAGELYQSNKRVRVPPEEHKLNVSVTTDKPQYQPGQTATYTLDVKDSAGKPVTGADFSVGVVDEAIYAIKPDATTDIVSFFFGRGDGNSVFTSSSLEYYFSGEAGKRRMRLAQLRSPSHFAQLKPERLVKPKVRKLFPDTAFWAADVTTDSAGHAVAKVPFPDSLTTWRATARGATRDTKVGAATLKTIVRKNLILRLAVPRFFVQGDEVVISAIVHNYLASDKTVRVNIKADGLETACQQTDLQIPAKAERSVDCRVRAKQVRTAKITGEALTDEESDALELDLPVNPPGVKLALSKGGSIPNANSAAFALTFPAQVEPGSRSIALRVSPSIAGSLFSALEYLTAFPYGCVEQTMSSFLPNIIVRQAIRDLGLKQKVDEAALNEKIRAGLDRLYSFQHEDGGWGWWQTDDSHPFMTAYVVAGLVQAKGAGVQVNEEAIAQGSKWIESHNDPKYLPDMRAYLAYSLSLAGKKSTSLPALDKLSPYGLAIMGMFSDQKPAIAALLEKQVKQNDTEAWWPAERDEMLDFSADITPEATAYAVKFLAQQNPNNPLLPKAAVWLMNHRSEGYWWSSTKQTAMVIYGLIDYLKASKELTGNINATVYVNDKPVITSIDSPEIVLDESKLQPGENRIRVTSTGTGRLYYSARAEYFSTQEKLEKTGKVGLNILRDYFRLVPGKTGDRIVYDLNPLEGSVQSGDVIAVRLTVTGSDWKYLLIEDPIPAGTEFIEKDNLYELKNRPPWWRYWFTRRELHDDRMAIFQTYFSQGQQQYFYLLKVVNQGLFKVSPARVQPMYQPEFMSTTESRKLEVLPK